MFPRSVTTPSFTSTSTPSYAFTTSFADERSVSSLLISTLLLSFVLFSWVVDSAFLFLHETEIVVAETAITKASNRFIFFIDQVLELNKMSYIFYATEIIVNNMICVQTFE